MLVIVLATLDAVNENLPNKLAVLFTLMAPAATCPLDVMLADETGVVIQMVKAPCPDPLALLNMRM